MRVNGIVGVNYPKNRANTSFSGIKMVKYINAKSDTNAIGRSVDEYKDFKNYHSMVEVTPGRPLDDANYSYAPDILLKCTYYLADDGEYASDRLCDTYNAVLTEINHGLITKEMANNKRATFADMRSMTQTLKGDIKYADEKLQNAKTEEERETLVARKAELQDLTKDVRKTYNTVVDEISEDLGIHYIPSCTLDDEDEQG